MEMETPLPKIEKHDLTIGAFRQRKRLGMDETRMAIKLLFGHGSEDRFNDCRIDVIHDLMEKRGNVFTAFRQVQCELWQIKRIRFWFL
jgi:hypothetical protein